MYRMEGRRNKKRKKDRKEEGIQGERRKEKRKKKKKRSSAGFKLVRLVLLVVLSVQREGVVGRIGFTFLPSWATLFAVVQPAVSPSPATPLCWVFCLSPREPVGPAGLCAQGLGRSCRCGPSQAARLLISQCAALGLSRARPADPAALGLSRVALGSAVLGLWVGQLASALGGHPPKVSGVGAPPGFHV